MEKQSKTNCTIYENVENDKSKIEMSEDPNSVHTYEAFEQLPVEQIENEDIYEDINVEKNEIKLSETKNPDSVHAYEIFKPHSTRHSDAIYENHFVYNKELTKAEISDPASTSQPPVRENPYVLDTSTENTSSTTT